MTPLDMRQPLGKIDFMKDFGTLPKPDSIFERSNNFVYRNADPPFYLGTTLSTTYTMTFDRLFKWHIFYITISLLFIGFLGFFLIRNLFLPMRYVTNLAKELGVEMKKEDFVSETFNEMYKKMKSKEETIVEFSSYIAHEFRNSIGAIIGLARLVERGKKPGSDIVKECRSMEDLIKRLVEYSRPLKTVVSSIDVNHLIDDAIAKISLPKRIILKKEIPSDLPHLKGDYELLLLAVTNLLKNGIEAVKKKGWVEIEANSDGEFLYIVVVDSGPGIDMQDIDKIFSPFYSKKEKGIGLGLAYVKKIMDLHNGQVMVEGRKGKGTKFILKFPSG
jgi:signal transduction histidine kinase